MTTKPKQGDDPAYPGDDGWTDKGTHYHGMTKREAMAMAADIPWEVVFQTLELKNPIGAATIGEILAARATMKVMEADALLAELNKQP